MHRWSRASASAAAWALLCVAAPTSLAQPEAPGPAHPVEGASGDAAQRVDELDALLREARFDEVVERADRLREELDAAGEGADLRRLRVRLEVAAATAEVALDRPQAARDAFRRALAAEPALDLAPEATAPKVLRVFRTVRAEARAQR